MDRKLFFIRQPSQDAELDRFVQAADRVRQETLFARDRKGRSREFRAGELALVGGGPEGDEIGLVTGGLNYYFTPANPDPTGKGRLFAPALAINLLTGEEVIALAEEVESLLLKYEPPAESRPMRVRAGKRSLSFPISTRVDDPLWFDQFGLIARVLFEAKLSGAVFTANDIIAQAVDVRRIEQMRADFQADKEVELEAGEVIAIFKCLELRNVLLVKLPRKYPLHKIDGEIYTRYIGREAEWRDPDHRERFEQVFLSGIAIKRE